MPDALELVLNVFRGCDIAVGEMAEVELDGRLQAPFERHLVDGPGALAAIHGGMEVPGRVEMGAVMGREVDLLDRPALAVGQILRLQPIEELQHPWQPLLMVDML